MAGEKLQFSHEDPEKKFALETKKMDLEAGQLGRFFGTGRSVSLNVAGATVLLLILSGIIVAFGTPSVFALDYWKITTPIITGALGFMFGKDFK